MQKVIRTKFKSVMSLFMAFLFAFGAVPANAFVGATALHEIEPPAGDLSEPFIAHVNGEDVLVSADGFAFLDIQGFSEPVKVEIPRYIYLDGERIYVDDDRIVNLAPVVMHTEPFGANFSPLFETGVTNGTIEETPTIGFIVAFSGAIPSNPHVEQIGNEYIHPAYVRMNGMIVSSLRYVVWINNVAFEAYCADPNLPPGLKILTLCMRCRA